MPANKSTRDPNTATQTGVNQLALATPLASLFGYYLMTKGIPPEVAAPATALAMAVVTTLGTVLRNVFDAKGWAKYIG